MAARLYGWWSGASGISAAQVLEHLRRDDAGTGVLGAAVHHAMADAEHARAAVVRAEPSGEHSSAARPSFTDASSFSSAIDGARLVLRA